MRSALSLISQLLKASKLLQAIEKSRKGQIREWKEKKIDSPVNIYIIIIIRRRRDLLNNLTIKNCDKIEKFKTILVKSLKMRRRFDVLLMSLSSQ